MSVYPAQEIVCVECKLPSHKGLPPFISVRRFIEGQEKKVLRHQICPDTPEVFLQYIEKEREVKLETFERRRKIVFGRKWTAPWRLI